MHTHRKVILIVSLGSLAVKDVQGGRVNIGIAQSLTPPSGGSQDAAQRSKRRAKVEGEEIVDG